ncbi:MAG TPA: NAD(P)-binding domain-containing protein [Acidimicrobiales bacterium]|nr:NAD(P)-binding domain-containing protein [Acidimicrobiales bacterium]
MARSRHLSTVIVGAGHNGLAMSSRLSDRGIDHVVLERGDVASSWRTQRWDSFTLLTPNWQARLPAHAYDGNDPDGFMTGAEIASFIQGYAKVVDAPVQTGTTVTSVRAAGGGYDVVSDDGTWSCRCVVLASGACALPSVPSFADAVPFDVERVNPLQYRTPSDLPDGGVLVVGAASTGIQLAEEIHASGRPVILSVGEHVRMPRTYRGRDIQHWMEAIGRLDERYDEVDEILRARSVASPQLIGTPERRTLDLNRLTDAGVRLRGRLGGVRDGVALFSGGLKNHCALADQKLGRLLDEIDEWCTGHGLDGAIEGPVRFEPTRVPSNTPLTLDLRSGEIATVVWATGFRPDLSWLELPVFDPAGRLRHDGGVVDAPGVYFLGATFLRRRRSSFIHGAESDTAELAAHLVDHLAAARR